MVFYIKKIVLLYYDYYFDNKSTQLQDSKKKKKNLRYKVEHLCAYNVSNYNSNYLNKIKKKKIITFVEHLPSFLLTCSWYWPRRKIFRR